MSLLEPSEQEASTLHLNGSSSPVAKALKSKGDTICVGNDELELGDSGDGEDTDSLILVQNKPASLHQMKISQKKRSELAALDSWVEKNKLRLSKPLKEVKTALEERPVSRMVRDFGDDKIIESPRDYQVELFERAKQKNTIAVLDTGKLQTMAQFLDNNARIITDSSIITDSIFSF